MRTKKQLGNVCFFREPWPLEVIKQTPDRVSATPREAVVLEHANTGSAIDQPTIPLC